MQRWLRLEVLRGNSNILPHNRSRLRLLRLGRGIFQRPFGSPSTNNRCREGRNSRLWRPQGSSGFDSLAEHIAVHLEYTEAGQGRYVRQGVLTEFHTCRRTLRHLRSGSRIEDNTYLVIETSTYLISKITGGASFPLFNEEPSRGHSQSDMKIR